MTRINNYAIIPAAGRSLRMGDRHKLLLPWHDATIMDQVLKAWVESRVSRVIIVVRQDDLGLREVCKNWPVDLVVPPSDPHDMKKSVQIGIQHANTNYGPGPQDRWLMAPADLPTLSTRVIDTLIAASESTDLIVVPRFGERRGHPVSFPWSETQNVMELEDDQGVNHLLDHSVVRWLDLPTGDHPEDIDTPSDYTRLSKRNSG